MFKLETAGVVICLFANMVIYGEQTSNQGTGLVYFNWENSNRV